jgi:P27 family predicted phage terminase small subunit
LSPAMDYPTVELAARTFDELAKYRRLVEKHGVLLQEPIVTPTGAVVGERWVPNPVVKMMRDAEKTLERWLVELGLTPSARARLGLVQVKAESKLDALIASRQARAVG